MSIDTGFVTEFYKRLKKDKIDYCILRNAEEVKLGDAHDVDMTVSVDRLEDMERDLFETALDYGWRVHVKTGDIKDDTNIKCYHFFRAENQEISIVHFDFFPTFSWNGYVLIDNKTLLEKVDKSTIYHAASPEIEAVTKLFIRLLHNGYIKSKYKRDIYEIFVAKPDSVCSILRCFLDEKGTEFVQDAVCKELWTKIEKNREYLVKNIKRNSKKSTIKQKMYLAKKAMGRAGIMVAFEGTDGSGKSTIINSLPDVLGNSFPEGMMDYYHWRPGYLKRERVSIDGVPVIVSEPHAKKPYGKLKSFAKFMFFNLDYILGYWCSIRWKVAKGHLVVFDRYYYDYYLDKLRYRLSISDKTLDLFKRIIPKPDITFLLIGDANVLFERKMEITVEEIQNQIDRLEKHKMSFSNPIEIDVNQSIDKAVYVVSREILRFGNSKYEERK